MQSVELFDIVHLETAPCGKLTVTTDLSYLPVGENNLAAAAARSFWLARGSRHEGLSIQIEKHIPVCAGMGGGSADAAAVIRALNCLEGEPFKISELTRIGETVGSDVPFCVLGGTAIAEGKGEQLQKLPPLPACWIVVHKPNFSVSTPEIFSRLDGVRIHCHPDTEGALAALAAGDLAGVARRMYNVMEDALPSWRAAEVASVKQTLIQCGALGASMSGSGPTVFGLFEDRKSAEQAMEQLQSAEGDSFLVRSAGNAGKIVL